MNETIKTAVNEACEKEFDLFEKAFDEKSAHHNFSLRHKRRMNAIFKNCDNPKVARKKLEGKPFWSEFGVKQLAAAAAGFAVIGGLMFGGVKVVDMFTDMTEVHEEQNKRYDYLLKDGNYYLEGDNSIYFKVENGSIKLFGDREKILEKYKSDKQVVEAYSEDPQFVEKWVEERTNLYMSGTQIAVIEVEGKPYHTNENGEKVPYDVLKYAFVEEVDKLTEPWHSYVFLVNEYWLTFDGEKTILFKQLGNFVLG